MLYSLVCTLHPINFTVLKDHQNWSHLLTQIHSKHFNWHLAQVLCLELQMWPITMSFMGKKLLSATWSFWQGEMKYGRNLRGEESIFPDKNLLKLIETLPDVLVLWFGVCFLVCFFFLLLFTLTLNVWVRDHCNPNIKNSILWLVPLPVWSRFCQ